MEFYENLKQFWNKAFLIGGLSLILNSCTKNHNIEGYVTDEKREGGHYILQVNGEDEKKYTIEIYSDFDKTTMGLDSRINKGTKIRFHHSTETTFFGSSKERSYFSNDNIGIIGASQIEVLD